MSKTTTDPLLLDDDNRFVMFPIQHNDIWQMYKKQIDCFWRPEEIDLSKDVVQWNTLNDKEKYYIKMILSFFAASDGIVIENLGMRFMSEIQNSEARAFYGFQTAMENIHSELVDMYMDAHTNAEGDIDLAEGVAILTTIANRRRDDQKKREAGSDIWLLLFVVIVSVLLGTCQFYRIEKKEQGWTFLDAFYFCIITSTSIGASQSFVYHQQLFRPSLFVCRFPRCPCCIVLVALCTLRRSGRLCAHQFWPRQDPHLGELDQLVHLCHLQQYHHHPTGPADGGRLPLLVTQP